MKIRIRDNTVRFRLTRLEVERLADGHAIQQTTRFSVTDRLVCAVLPTTEPTARVTFAEGMLLLKLPESTIRHWADTSEVGIPIEQVIDSDTKLIVLIEKDFACLHRSTDDTPDAYPNPLG